MTLYAAAAAILLYMCLAPTRDVPGADLFWDKTEHATAWFILTASGLLLSPRRPRAVCAFAVLMGAGVEVLQATMDFGRDGDWRDLAADSVGVAVAAALFVVVNRLRLP